MSFQADFENSFNCISRHLNPADPAPLHWLRRSRSLLFDELWLPVALERLRSRWPHRILSQERVRQGDPLEPFFLAIALQSVLEVLSEEIKNDSILRDISC